MGISIKRAYSTKATSQIEYNTRDLQDALRLPIKGLPLSLNVKEKPSKNH